MTSDNAFLMLLSLVELLFLGGKSGYVLLKVFLLDLTQTVVFVLVNVSCL